MNLWYQTGPVAWGLGMSNKLGVVVVTHNFLRYTFPDVISSSFKADLTHTADAAIPAYQGGTP